LEDSLEPLEPMVVVAPVDQQDVLDQQVRPEKLVLLVQKDLKDGEV